MQVGVLSLDVDENASRLMVIDRTTSRILIYNAIPPSPIYQIVLPYKYTLNNNLICMIIDLNNIYAAQSVDGVKLEAAIYSDVYQ